MENPDPFSIENTLLGRKLVAIQNNKPQVQSPVFLAASTVLSVRQLIQVISNGLLVDTSLGSFTITTPSAAAILAAIPMVATQQFKFTVGSFGTANVNTVTLAGGAGVLPAGGVPIVISSQNTRNVTLTCYNVAVPAFVLSLD